MFQSSQEKSLAVVKGTQAVGRIPAKSSNNYGFPTFALLLLHPSI